MTSPSPVITQARALRSASLLRELHALVLGECPSLLNEDSGGDAKLALAIEEVLAITPASQAPPRAKRPRAFLIVASDGTEMVFTSEDEAQRRADALGLEYHGLYLRTAEQPAIRVKFIDWRDMTYNGVEEWVGHCALSDSFTIKDEGSQPEYRFVVRPFLGGRTSFPTANEAKNAAQADYVERILNALEHLPRALDLARQKEAGHVG